METLEAGDWFCEGAHLSHVVHELLWELLEEKGLWSAFHGTRDDGLKEKNISSWKGYNLEEEEKEVMVNWLSKAYIALCFP